MSIVSVVPIVSVKLTDGLRLQHLSVEGARPFDSQHDERLEFVFRRAWAVPGGATVTSPSIRKTGSRPVLTIASLEDAFRAAVLVERDRLSGLYRPQIHSWSGVIVTSASFGLSRRPRR